MTTDPGTTKTTYDVFELQTSGVITEHNGRFYFATPHFFGEHNVPALSYLGTVDSDSPHNAVREASAREGK